MSLTDDKTNSNQDGKPQESKVFLGFLSPWLALGRVSNLPTCFTNVLVGWLLAVRVQNVHFNGFTSNDADRIVLLLFAASCYYIAGMAMNDFVDVVRDSQSRSFRPIVSGRISRRGAGIFIFILCVLATLCTWTIGPLTGKTGLGLLLSIALYNILHGKYGISIVFMGLCRALLYLLGAVTVWDMVYVNVPVMALITLSGILWPMAGLMLYTMLVTWVARFEDQQLAESSAKLRMLSLLTLFIPLLFVFTWHDNISGDGMIGLLVGAALWVLWTLVPVRHVGRKPPKMIHAIMAWLAGMCIMDLMLILSLEDAASAIAATACFVLTINAQRKILGS